MASANCGVGRELPDAFAVIQLKLGCTPTGTHVPRMLTIIRRSAQGDTRDRTDEATGRLSRAEISLNVPAPFRRAIMLPRKTDAAHLLGSRPGTGAPMAAHWGMLHP